MTIAVASGKGGTGKTTVATSLALALQAAGSVEFLDCDVEEPNAHLFLKPDIERREKVELAVPQVDDAKCTLCGRCAEVCQFKAIAVLKDSVLVFPELCHGCTACWVLCPPDAITPGGREVGVVESGRAGPMGFHHGWLRIGEAMSPPLIRAVKQRARAADATVIDVPPGTSCPVVESVRDADAVVLVTEPTPFGLYDLNLMVSVLEVLGLPSGIVINRDDGASRIIDDYASRRHIPVLMRIPLKREIAEHLSRGIPMVEADGTWESEFLNLAEKIEHSI